MTKAADMQYTKLCSVKGAIVEPGNPQVTISNMYNGADFTTVYYSSVVGPPQDCTILATVSGDLLKVCDQGFIQ